MSSRSNTQTRNRRRRSVTDGTSTIHNNDPDTLELEKQRNLARKQHLTSTPISEAPGWNEHLASSSEAHVKVGNVWQSSHSPDYKRTDARLTRQKTPWTLSSQRQSSMSNLGTTKRKGQGAAKPPMSGIRLKVHLGRPPPVPVSDLHSNKLSCIEGPRLM